jgi:hypothetical protein
MIFYIALIALLAAISGAAKAVMDVANDRNVFYTSRLYDHRNTWIGPRDETWGNKWKDTCSVKLKPAFFGSSTFLVAFTDLWHFTQMLTWTTAEAVGLLLIWLAGTGSCPTNAVMVGAIFTFILRRIVFELVYRHLTNHEQK